MSRRSFLHQALLGSALAAGGLSLHGCGLLGAEPSPGAGAPDGGRIGPLGSEAPPGRLVPGAVEGRILVVIDLQGGNDGLSTLVPYADGRYHDLRPNLAIDPDDVLPIDDEVALHPSLARLAERGVAVVEGVGPVDGDLSHFNMADRWQRGDVNGTDHSFRTGVLGRLTDAVDNGSPLAGFSMGGFTPYLVNERAAVMALDDPGRLWMLRPTAWGEMDAFRRLLARFDSTETAPAVTDSYQRLLEIAERLDPGEDEVDWEDPMLTDGGDLGWQLAVAADLLIAGVGTRVVYAATGDYDTHADHGYRQLANLAEVDAAVDGFLGRIDEAGLADRDLVATVSEFGRRVPENGSGLDHGTASTMLLAGAGLEGRYGEPPDLGDLDPDDNLRTTVPFDRYLASLAEDWLGVEAATVLAGAPEPLGLV
ncbi:MAG: DUF1501 domain-containing protein [Actinomycetota bacterium]